MADEMVIFTKTYDLLAWLLERSEGFPRAHRFVVNERLLNAILNFQEHIIDANAVRGDDRAKLLRQADADLRKLKLYLRLAHRMRWLSDGQLKHVSGMTAEVGRLLGGWLKQTEKR